ncbi:MAG: tyrosine-type recombinase/integrase [Christensenellaceae bacterium]
MKHDTVEGTSLSFHEQKYFFVNLLADPKISHVKKCYSIFIYLTGARRNEALDLTTEDVQRVLHINGTKTDGSDRYVPLLPLVEKLLKSITPKDGKYFPFSEYVADTTFKKYGAPHKLHDLRHTYGTIQICVNKLDIKTVSLYMGHSTIETTLRIYTHPEQLDRETFLNGSLKEEERLEILRKEYAEILAIIEDFLK